MFKFRVLQLPLLLLASSTQGRAQFAHTDHKQIVDAVGRPLLLRRHAQGIGTKFKAYALFDGNAPEYLRAFQPPG